MGLNVTASLGIAFLVLAFFVVFLMFHLWGYPFDKATRTSAAPPGLMRLHRLAGWLYVVIYIVMMVAMVPRLWEYQVEFPPRTVAHLLFGIGIGVILLVKVAILRFFRHFEEWMPVLGVLLLTCTIMLSTLSLPLALREYSLASSAAGGNVYSQESRERVTKLLPTAGLPEGAPLDQLATAEALRAGRNVLSGKCVVCHDLKTILVLPRSPGGWWKIVDRMANKPTFAEPMTELETYQVTAYLIAISGDLQRDAKQRRAEEDKRKDSAMDIAQDAAATDQGAAGELPPFDAAEAAATYERVCSSCHGLEETESAPPKDADQVKDLIIRMIRENGMEASKEELDLIYLHMVKKFAGGRLNPAPAEVPAAAQPVEPEPEPEPEPTAEALAQPTKAPKKPAAAGIDARPLYDKHCKSCHAIDGSGTEAMKKNSIPDLTDKAWQAKHSKAKIVAAIVNGVPDTKMKSYKDKLSAEEIDAVAALVKKMK
jgi:mono/diheme cytochrome c family protein